MRPRTHFIHRVVFHHVGVGALHFFLLLELQQDLLHFVELLANIIMGLLLPSILALLLGSGLFLDLLIGLLLHHLHLVVLFLLAEGGCERVAELVQTFTHLDLFGVFDFDVVGYLHDWLIIEGELQLLVLVLLFLVVEVVALEVGVLEDAEYCPTYSFAEGLLRDE